VVARLKGVQHLDDVLVPEVPQDLDLLPQVADVLLALALLHDELHGRDLAGAAAAAFVDLRGAGWGLGVRVGVGVGGQSLSATRWRSPAIGELALLSES